MKVRLAEMSWPEVKEALSKPNVVIIPIGATEQHGTHLPLNIDSFSATYMAERAAEKVVNEHKICVLVAPTIHYTDVSVHKMFPGTIGVKVDTLIKMIVDIVRSFLDQGFKNIVAFNSHVQNNCAIESALRMISADDPDANVYAISLRYLGIDVRGEPVKAGIAGMGHALEVETSRALLLQPQRVHLDKAVIGSRQLILSERYIGVSGTDTSKGVIYHPVCKGFEESGTWGDPTKSSKEAGEKLLAAQTSDLADIIVQVVRGTK